MMKKMIILKSERQTDTQRQRVLETERQTETESRGAGVGAGQGGGGGLVADEGGGHTSVTFFSKSPATSNPQTRYHARHPLCNDREKNQRQHNPEQSKPSTTMHATAERRPRSRQRHHGALQPTRRTKPLQHSQVNGQWQQRKVKGWWGWGARWGWGDGTTAEPDSSYDALITPRRDV